MKKTVMICVCALLLGCSVFALELSSGLGTSFGMTGENNSGATKPSYRFFAFFDAEYSLASLEMMKDDDWTYGSLALFAKYPFHIRSYVLSPMAGIGYERAFDTPSRALADLFSHFFFRGGLALDMPISDRLYARPAFLYTRYLNNSDEELYLVRWGIELSVAVGLQLGVSTK